MRNLEDFPVPNDGEITLCEINGRMQCMNYEYANVSTFTTSTDRHPKIHITRDLLHHTTLGDEGKALFLPTDVPFLKQLTQVYSEHGFKEVLHTSSMHHTFIISKTALLLLSIFRYFRKAQLLLNPSLEYEGTYLIDELSQTRNWTNSSIKCIAWHLHNSRLAVATSDDSVRIYCNDNNFVPLLRCKQQQNITCLAWRPMSLTEIAVGHETGIIIWHVDFNSLVSRPSVSNTIMLHRVEHQPIMSLAWSHRGNILASRVQAACWSNCGTNLLFATNTDPVIYGLTIKSDQVFTSTVDTSINHATPLFDLTKLDLEGIAVGGIVQSMETDPKGNHLAVFFKTTNCVALFNVTRLPILQLIPSSLIVGLAAEVPSTIGFQQNFKAGACLSIGWSSGRLQHFPIIYTDLASDFSPQ
ncbi:aladin [Asbolus verrucosus]|uniref:Aladin n=1 Tax=Asbolus verrucosus TaxID=1661398 RepID=A0A482VNH0_ASBVE|nr:aladin [Asbolus verrucosus]